MSNQLVDNPAMHRFELPLGDDEIAAAYYGLEGDRLAIIHTEVPFRLSGQGIGSRLARSVFEEARQRGIRLVIRCPFFSAFLARHPEYSELVDG